MMYDLREFIKQICYYGGMYFYKILEKIPRNKRIWVFGAWDGKQFSDNSKYMFLYTNKYHKEIKAIWITRNKKVLKQVREKGYIAYKRNSVKGIYYCIRASAVFVTQGRGDVSGILTAGANIIQLWHGMGIKDVSNVLAIPECEIQRKYLELVHAHSNENWMVANNEAIEKYAKAFSVPHEKMHVTGQPKDDSFFFLCENQYINSIKELNPGKKIVVYLPTHRKFGNNLKNNEILSYEKLIDVNKLLKENNIIMIFKPHFHEFKNYINVNVNLDNIIFATDTIKYGDVYEFLPACDALITDYSGIMLSYLAVGKPIIYFPYDIDEYMNNDLGLCYSYEDVTAGPICYKWSEVISELTNSFQNDEFSEKRKKLSEKFCPMFDGNSCYRVYKETKKLVNKKS